MPPPAKTSTEHHAQLPTPSNLGRPHMSSMPSVWQPPASLPSTIPKGLKFPPALTIRRARYGLPKPYPAKMRDQIKALGDMACTPGPNTIRKAVGFKQALSSDTWDRCVDKAHGVGLCMCACCMPALCCLECGSLALPFLTLSCLPPRYKKGIVRFISFCHVHSSLPLASLGVHLYLKVDIFFQYLAFLQARQDGGLGEATKAGQLAVHVARWLALTQPAQAWSTWALEELVPHLQSMQSSMSQVGGVVSYEMPCIPGMHLVCCSSHSMCFNVSHCIGVHAA